MATYTQALAAARVESTMKVSEVDDADALLLAQGIIRQLNGRGLLADLSDDTITLVTDTYAYTLPDDFIWVYRLQFEDDIGSGEYYEPVPHFHWSLHDAAGTAKVEFYENMFDMRPGYKVRVIGQGRFSEPAALADTIPPVLEGIVGESLLLKLMSVGSQGRSELAIDRSSQRRELKALFDDFVANASFRVLPSSRRVPGR